MTRFRLNCLVLLSAFILSACLPSVSTQTPTPSATASPTTFPTTPDEPSTPSTAAKRVFILSIDGMRPEAIAQAPMPNLQALMQAGAYSLTARTVLPSETLPAHTSMLTGLCPSKHGVDWNVYLPEFGFARGVSLFELAHDTGLFTVMVTGKEKLRQVTDPANTDVFTYYGSYGLVIAQNIIKDFPDDFGVLFVHFSTPDFMGHAYGWMSAEYLQGLREDDQGLGLLLDALNQSGLRAETLIIVTADHGGHGMTHGSELPEDMIIPWVAAGPGVAPMVIPNPVNITDTAATAAWALNLTIPPEWDGIPVYEAFGLPYQTRSDPRCQ